MKVICIQNFSNLFDYRKDLIINKIYDVDNSIWDGFYHIKINDEHSYYFESFIFIELSKYRKDKIFKILRF